MGLSNFKSDSGGDSGENEETTQDKTETDNQESSDDLPAEYCPECETEGEETDHWYYRCTTPSDECSVITFIKPREKNQ